MKKFWKLKLIATIAFLAAIGLDVYAFMMDNLVSTIVLGITGALVVMAIVLFIIDAIRKKSYKRFVAKTESDYEEQFHKEAEEKSFDSIDDLFVEEFDVEDEASEDKKEEQVFWDDTSKYIDLGFTVEAAVEQIRLFMLEKGFDISIGECAKLLSAYSSSRFIIADTPECERIFSALAEYFGTSYYCENLVDGTEGDLLYRTDENGGRSATALVNAIALAKENKEKVFTVLFTNVRAKELFDLFLPYFRYFSNPLRKCKVTVKAPSVSFVLPENLWIAVKLAEGESMLNVAETALKASTVLNLNYSKTDPAEERGAYKPIGYYQIDYFVQRCRNNFALKEDLWKKVDALEAFVNTHGAYTIGNKQWLQMETYLSVLSVFEKEDYIALDIALSLNLLPEIMAVLNGKIKTGEKTLTEELEQLFGEDKISMCHKILKGNAFAGM